MTNKNNIFIVIFIAILTLLLRLVWLSKFPPLLTQDEASIAFNSWSILQTGRDEWGNSWPLVFSAFGDAKQPLYIYLSSIFFSFTGWGNGQVRLVSAVSGSLSVLLFGSWVWLKTKNLNWSFLGALLIATSPWAIHLSRMALESNLAMMFFLSGLVLMEWGVTHLKRKRLILFSAAGMFALSTYSYISYRLVIPLFLLAWSAITWLTQKHTKTKTSWSSIFLALLALIIFTLPGWLQGGSTTRLQQVGLLGSDASKAIQFELRNNCHLLSFEYHAPWIRYGCAVVWNKFTIPVWLIGRNWLQHLSLDFLFLVGDDNVYRNPLLTGSFFFWLAPFYLLGWYQAIKNWPHYGYLVIGVIISVIPSVLTADPQAIRLSPLLPLSLMLIVLGLQQVQKQIPPRWHVHYRGLLAILILFWTIISIPTYLVNTFSNSSGWLAHGKQVAAQVNFWNKQGYPVYIDPNVIPEAHIFIAYWNQWDPQQYQAIDKQPAVDKLEFRRPTQLGSQIIFREISIISIICPSVKNTEDLPTSLVYISNDPQLESLPSEKEINSLNAIHTFGRVYRIDNSYLHKNEKLLTQFCSSALQ